MIDTELTVTADLRRMSFLLLLLGVDMELDGPREGYASCGSVLFSPCVGVANNGTEKDSSFSSLD